MVGKLNEIGDVVNKLDELAIERFRNSLHGDLIRPGDENYDEARKVYNAMIDKRPGFIARCTDANDVIAAVNFWARQRPGGCGARRRTQRRRVGDLR